MGFPMLVAAIRNSGQTQWRISQLADIPESRLSRIIRRGVATEAERRALSQLLGIDQGALFAAGPPVTLHHGGD